MNGWSERTAVFAHDERRGVTVETTWLPALAGLGPEALADAHARQLAAAGVMAAEVSVREDASLERPLRSPGQVGLAHYLLRNERLVRSIATAAEGTPDRDLQAALRIAAERDTAVSLSTLEARYVEGLLGVPPVGFLPASWWHDLDTSVRDLVGRELARGLVGRGLLCRGTGAGAREGARERVADQDRGEDAVAEGAARGGAGGPDLSLSPSLRRAVEPVLDADLVVVARRIGDDTEHTVALGRREAAWSLVGEKEPGQMSFMPLESTRVADRLLDALGVPGDVPRLPDAGLDEVDAFPVLWQLTCVRAHEDGLQSAELVWCFDSDGRLWTVPPPAVDETVRLESVGSEELRAAVTGLLEPQGVSA